MRAVNTARLGNVRFVRQKRSLGRIVEHRDLSRPALAPGSRGGSSIVEHPIHTRFICRGPLVTGNLAAVNLCDTSEHVSLPDSRRRFSRPLRRRRTPAGVMAASGTVATAGAVAFTVAARALSVASLWVR